MPPSLLRPGRFDYTLYLDPPMGKIDVYKRQGLARNTSYKYKSQIRAELMAEQDLPKGASIFYEPPKSF